MTSSVRYDIRYPEHVFDDGGRPTSSLLRLRLCHDNRRPGILNYIIRRVNPKERETQRILTGKKRQ